MGTCDYSATQPCPGNPRAKATQNAIAYPTTRISGLSVKQSVWPVGGRLVNAIGHLKTWSWHQPRYCRTSLPQWRMRATCSVHHTSPSEAPRSHGICFLNEPREMVAAQTRVPGEGRRQPPAATNRHPCQGIGGCMRRWLGKGDKATYDVMVCLAASAGQSLLR
jgi:hypothetical protein